ncbi:Protein of unknown function [Lactobacillus helveticus CIRM-BIA 103]|jgi:hypothetical protein
MRKRK